ncbi:MAG: alpha/beta fold hydrolase [Planctomycetota bacterium]
MRSESIELLLSFVSVLLIPIIVVLLVAGIRRCFGKPIKVLDWGIAGGISVAITICITLGICLIFHLTGFFESNFFRPSGKDYGIAAQLDVEPEEVTFESSDGTKLHAWILKAQGDPKGTVVHFHGSDRNITFTAGNVAWLTDEGYNVFAFDYRGYGKSEGLPSHAGTMADSIAALRFALSHPEFESQDLVLFGQSMGGQLAIIAASEVNDERVASVVSEATYGRRSLHLSDKLGRLGPLWLVKWGGWLFTSDQSCGESAANSLQDTPLLLIHGDADGAVAPYHAERLRDAAGVEVELWKIAGAGHLEVFRSPENRKRLIDYVADRIGVGEP